MRHATVAVFFAGILLFAGCAVPQYVTVNETRPATYNVGTNPDVSLVDVQGGRRDMQDVVAESLVRHSRENGFFIVRDRRGEGIRFDARDGQMVMTGADASVGNDDVYVIAYVLDQYGSEQEGIVRSEATLAQALRGESGQATHVFETTVPVAFTAGTRNGVLFEQREYDGVVRWRIEQRPTDRRMRFEQAAAAAAALFLNDISPSYVSNRVRLDNSDRGQNEILKAATQGNVREALTLMQSYAQTNPNTASARYNVAAMTDALGDYREAIELYDQAIALGGQPWYIESKTEAMRRLNEQAEFQSESRAALGSESERRRSNPDPAPEPQPAAADAYSSAPPDRAEIQEVQACLNALGYACGGADGIMGPNTRQCIAAFQVANDIVETGNIDAPTRAALAQECG